MWKNICILTHFSPNKLKIRPKKNDFAKQAIQFPGKTDDQLFPYPAMAPPL